MQETWLTALRFRSPQIRARWEALLHVEPVTTPLANPHALVHLIAWTLGEIIDNLSPQSSRQRVSRRTASVAQGSCCGRNPFLAYFAAGRQAMREALILVQAATPHLDPIERDVALMELNMILDHIARREIEAFCGVCQHRSAVVGPNASECFRKASEGEAAHAQPALKLLQAND